MKGLTLAAFRRTPKPGYPQGWSQAELAARTNGAVSESLIALIETDRRQPSIESAEAIAEALGLPLEAICDLLDPDAEVPA